MSWKRCWNNSFNGHGGFELEDDQIVPDIDRRTSSSSSSSLSSASSATSVDLPSSSVSIRIDTHYHHHAPPPPNHGSNYRPVSSSSASSSHHRNFSSKRDTFGNNANNTGNSNNNSISMANGGGMLGQQRGTDNGRTSPMADYYRVLKALKTSPNYSSSSAAPASSNTTPSPFSWNNKSPVEGNTNDYYGSSRKADKRSALELNDFWEEKYSRIAVISTTTNHFGPMANKF